MIGILDLQKLQRQ